AFSDKYKASWFIKASPLSKPGPLLVGALKSILLRFFIPIYILLAVFIISFWGLKTIDDCLFGLLGISLFLIIAALLAFRKIPFSESWANMNKGTNFANSMLVLIIGSFLGLLHYLIVNQFILMLGLAGVFIVLIYFIYRSYLRLDWRFIS
ncbi:MAG: hypothetical protein SFU99_09060, partial [Saprospiraceae bacterium]|nr:hypothetical protein [Saprospiraceae bacterium]